MMSSSFFSSNQLQVKICGLTSTEDAQDAIRAGADALGFNFHFASTRFVTLHHALQIISELPREEDVAYVAVVVNPSLFEVRMLEDAKVWHAIQFHGNETPRFCEYAGFPIWIKAIRITNFEETERLIRTYPTPYILLDANTNEDLDSEGNAVYGGTGKLIDLSLAARIVQAFPEKYFLLAGGLRLENIGEAIQTVCPYAVDVATGVEHKPARKDFLMMKNFIRTAKNLK
jgi:phosphoribosylanthranilate isomerase